MRKSHKVLTLICSALLMLSFAQPAQAAGTKISYTGFSGTPLQVGSSVVVEFRLSEPIICQDLPCEVRLNFTNSDPSTLTLSSTEVVWTANTWSQVRSFTVRVAEGITSAGSSSVTLSAVAVSNSEYYRSHRVTITQSIILPLSPAQVAANEKTAAANAVAEAARLRTLEILNYRQLLYEKLMRSERPTLKEYRDAVFLNVRQNILAAVTDEILKLEKNLRASAERIEKISFDLAFQDDFFNVTTRPTLDIYPRYGVLGVTERTLAAVNTRILTIPAAKRSDIIAIQEIATEEAFIDRVANPETRNTITSAVLIQRGLLPAETPYKHSVRSGLSGYPEGSLNTLAKIEAAIKAELEKAGARKAKTAEIRARIAARNR